MQSALRSYLPGRREREERERAKELELIKQQYLGGEKASDRSRRNCHVASQCR